MAPSTSVTVVYMTPSLEGLEGVDPADEFENLGDLARRAQLDGIEAAVNKALIYYQYFLDAKDSKRVLIAMPYDGSNGFVLRDEEDENYHVVDRKNLTLDHDAFDILDKIRNRAKLDTVDELLKRSLILFECVVQAREAGWGVAFFDPKTKKPIWITEDLKTTMAPSAHGPGKPIYQ